MKQTKTKNLVLMGLLTAIVFLFSFTPYGTIPIGPLSITLNIIPIALAAVTLGPKGGAIMGAVFGLLSFCQCLGIGVPSAMGIAMFNINPLLTFIQRFVPRVLDGFLVGYIYQFSAKKINKETACFITGFFSAFLNTLLFMSALVLLFSDYAHETYAANGENIILAVCAAIAVNAITEMIASTIITGAIGVALHKANLIQQPLFS